MVGEEYGYLTILEVIRERGKHTKAKCQCICGSIKDYRLSAVKAGNSQSCNCMRSTDTMKSKPGYKAIFSTWDNILGRCYRPKNDAYRWYGAKGIEMCKEWRYNFKAFYEWSIANGWEEGLVLDKDELSADLDLPIYSPSTCQWVTREYNLRKDW